jgi:hypothetical protein
MDPLRPIEPRREADPVTPATRVRLLLTPEEREEARERREQARKRRRKAALGNVEPRPDADGHVDLTA